MNHRKLLFVLSLGLLVLMGVLTQFTIAQDESLEQAITFAIGPDQEPGNVSLGNSNPSGTGAFVINADGSFVGITFAYSDLTGTPSAMHVHNAAAGENGGVVQKICGQGPSAGLLDNCPSGTSGIIAVIWELSSDMLDELLAGNLYINIHTAQNGGGEIRGQMTGE